MVSTRYLFEDRDAKGSCLPLRLECFGGFALTLLPSRCTWYLSTLLFRPSACELSPVARPGLKPTEARVPGEGERASVGDRRRADAGSEMSPRGWCASQRVTIDSTLREKLLRLQDLLETPEGLWAVFNKREQLSHTRANTPTPANPPPPPE